MLRLHATVQELEQFATDIARHLGYEGLKDKQLEAIVSFLQGNDTSLLWLGPMLLAGSHALLLPHGFNHA